MSKEVEAKLAFLAALPRTKKPKEVTEEDTSVISRDQFAVHLAINSEAIELEKKVKALLRRRKYDPDHEIWLIEEAQENNAEERLRYCSEILERLEKEDKEERASEDSGGPKLARRKTNE